MARRTSKRETLRAVYANIPDSAHPEYSAWIEDWEIIRDAADGERSIKFARDKYLPKFDGMDNEEYAAYLDRATYYNFTGRTIRALVGSIARRAPLLENIPERLKPTLENITYDNQSFTTFIMTVASECLSLGRYGVLVDLPSGPRLDPKPYMAGYLAENIIDWTTEIDPDTGRQIVTRVVLREWELSDSNLYEGYRVLKLTRAPAGWVYSQEIYKVEGGSADLSAKSLKQTIVPEFRGQPLSYIPFVFFGVKNLLPTIDTPPLLDIAYLNLSHYRSYAHLEQGRFFTGFPIYSVEIDGEGSGEYEIGSNRVWEIAKGCSARILEFNGHGLKSLETALDQKEAQAASLGGRMIGVRSAATTESDNQLKMKDRNEQSLLLDVSTRLDEGATTLMRWFALLSGVSKTEADKIRIVHNKDFLFDGVGAREFRAIHAMFKDGVIPVEVVYHYLKKGDVIPDWMTLDEFKKLLTDMDSFPNQPDAEARAAGYPDAASQLAEEEANAQRDFDGEQADAQRKTDEKTAKETAKAAAAAKPIPGGNPAAAKPTAAVKPAAAPKKPTPPTK